MVVSGDEFFYKNVIDTSSDDESDDDFLMEARESRLLLKVVRLHFRISSMCITKFRTKQFTTISMLIWLSTCGRMLATILQIKTMMKILKKTMHMPFVSFYILFEQVLCHLIGGQ
jgi:hypothetical protein